MKFLADQGVWAATTVFLHGVGHEVVTASDPGMAEADDIDLLHAAQGQGRIFVTRDRDYGRNAPGVIYSSRGPK